METCTFSAICFKAFALYVYVISIRFVFSIELDLATASLISKLLCVSEKIKYWHENYDDTKLYA